MTEDSTSRPIRVDAHHHFWPQPTRFAYPWMTDEQAALRRPFGPDDLRPLLEAREIDWTVLVQTRSSLDETRDFLAIADRTDFVAGVVGWVDLAFPNLRLVIDHVAKPAIASGELEPWASDLAPFAELLTDIGMSETAQAKVFGENARSFYAPTA